ncbi:hypothetical protein [Roseovarius nitratireducens]|uniref:hypothetical protein n=1 Tax=Roseovarius nitratireducens TaxID=2044597 RepID=UPI00101AE3F3|nr:hypothetical protein [Roseovarius nitratireducens]
MSAEVFRTCAASVAVLASMACDVHVQAGQPISVDELKQTYLACERRALAERISTNEIMHCSVAYEELKRRAFDDNWIKLWKWSQRALSQSPDANIRASIAPFIPMRIV